MKNKPLDDKVEIGVMEMDRQRCFRILQKLQKADRAVTSEELAATLRVSSKTIRKDVADLNTEMRYGQIISVPGAGICLQTENTDEIRELLERLCDSPAIPATKEGRTAYLIDAIINSASGYMKAAELAEELYISIPILSGSLKHFREVLKDYRLVLEQKPHYGLTVEGTEFDKRICLAAQAREYVEKRLYASDVIQATEAISDIVAQCIIQSSTKMADTAYEGLLASIVVLLYRNLCLGKTVGLAELQFDTVRYFDVYILAQQIIGELEKLCGCTLPGEETIYLATYLAGRQTLRVEAFIENSHPNASQLVELMTAQVYQSLNIDLRYDQELRESLMVHLIPLEVRINSGTLLTNPMLDEIKSKYTLAYNCAVLACGVLSKAYGKPISDDEIGFVTLLFGLAIERQELDVQKKNILVMCASGECSAKFLAYEIEKRFMRQLRSVRVVTKLELQEIDLRKWDAVFSTIPLPESIGLPAVQIGSFLDDGDIAAISKMLNQKRMPFQITKLIRPEFFFSNVVCNNKKEVLSFLVGEVQKVRDLPSCFMEYLWMREENGKTELGNMVAIPHPYLPITEDTFVAVAILRQPIVWDKEKVQVVFLISAGKYPSNDTEQLYKAISRLLHHNAGLSRVVKRGDYETLIQTLTKLQIEGD